MYVIDNGSLVLVGIFIAQNCRMKIQRIVYCAVGRAHSNGSHEIT